MDRTESRITSALCAASVSVTLLLSACSGGSVLKDDAGPADAGRSSAPVTTTTAAVTSTSPAPSTTAAEPSTPASSISNQLTEGHVFIATPAPGGGPKGLLGITGDSKITVLGISTDPSTQWYLKRIRAGTFQLMSPVNSEEIDAYCLSNDAQGGFGLAVCNKKKAAQAFTFSARSRKNTFTISAAGGPVSIEDDGIVSGPGRTPTVFTVTPTPEDG
jgi:hypothetical protein